MRFRVPRLRPHIVFVSVWAACTVAQAQDQRVSSFALLASQGNRPAWSVNNIIAYDAPSGAGFFDVYTMNPDGSNVQCLTCGVATLPPYNKGLPDWHPSGNYFALEVETVAFTPGTSAGNGSTPGGGYGNDLFIADAAGKNYYQMTNVNQTGGGVSGVLHERFSHDGTKILWSQAIPGSSGQLYNMILADFSVDANGVPSISNLTSLPPCASGQYFCEGGTFSLDDSTVFFTGTLDGQQKTGLDIYSYNLNTGVTTNLTNSPNTWDELPIALPTENKILWMSGHGNPDARDLKSDYWTMDYDGGNKLQVTFYNAPGAIQWDSVQGSGPGVSSAEEAWSPDGSTFLGELTVNGVSVGQGGQLYSHAMQVAAPVLSAASYARPPIGQDSIVTTFYSNLASTSMSASTSTLPTNLGGTTATLTDAVGNIRDVPFFFVSPGQINWLVPSGTATGPAVLQITNPQNDSVLSTINIQNVGPGLFTANASGSGAVIGSLLTYPQGSTQFTTQSLYSGGNANPVSLGDDSTSNFLVLYGTGLRNYQSSLSAQIGSTVLPVAFTGAQGTFFGLDQVNILVPHSFAGSGLQNLTVTVDGATSNTVQVQFQ